MIAATRVIDALFPVFVLVGLAAALTVASLLVKEFRR